MTIKEQLEESIKQWLEKEKTDNYVSLDKNSDLVSICLDGDLFDLEQLADDLLPVIEKIVAEEKKKEREICRDLTCIGVCNCRMFLDEDGYEEAHRGKFYYKALN